MYCYLWPTGPLIAPIVGLAGIDKRQAAAVEYDVDIGSRRFAMYQVFEKQCVRSDLVYELLLREVRATCATLDRLKRR